MSHIFIVYHEYKSGNLTFRCDAWIHQIIDHRSVHLSTPIQCNYCYMEFYISKNLRAICGLLITG